MKKFISLVLAVLMLMALCVPAMALTTGNSSDEFYEVIEFTKDPVAESEHFQLVAGYYDDYGWQAGFGTAQMTVETKFDCNYKIKRIEAIVSDDSKYFDYLKADPGSISKGGDEEQLILVIDDIDSKRLIISGTRGYVKLKDVTVYYDPSNSSDYFDYLFDMIIGSTFGSGNFWITVAIGAAAVVAISVIMAKKKEKAEKAAETEEKEE